MKTISKRMMGFCIVTVFVLLCVRFTFAYDSQKNLSPYHLTEKELDMALQVDAQSKRPDDYVRVLYFHRVPGCAACQVMSRYIYETILNKYPEEVRNRKIILRYYNFEDPKHAKLVKTFKIVSPTLVLIQGRNGKDVKAKYADKIWTLAGDKTDFMKYIEKEIDSYLKPAKESKNN